MHAHMHTHTHTHIPQPSTVSSSKMSSEVGGTSLEDSIAAGDEAALKDGVGEEAALKEGLGLDN